MLKGGIVGFGNVAVRGHLPAYSRLRDIEIIAATDACGRRLTYAQQIMPKIRIYKTATDMFQHENLDFVDICTPPASRLDIIKEAGRHGLNVLCEKPLAISLTDAEEILKIARKFSIRVFPCHIWKYAPQFKEVKIKIDNLKIGSIQFIQMNTFRPSFSKGNDAWNPCWRTDPKISGGGVMMDHGIHNMYLAMWLTGKKPLIITAKMEKLHPEKYAVEDTAWCLLDFKEIMAQINLTWVSKRREVMCWIHGSDGTAVISEKNVVTISKNGEKRCENFVESLSQDSYHENWFFELIKDFKTKLVSQELTNEGLLEAKKALECVLAAYASSQKGCKVILQE